MIGRFRRFLWALGCVAPPNMTRLRPMGASVHYAGTVPMLADGDVYADQAAADAALAAATAELAQNEFVAPYLFEVRQVDGKIVPVKEREIVRAAGPTVHPHTGKQAGQYNA